VEPPEKRQRTSVNSPIIAVSGSQPIIANSDLLLSNKTVGILDHAH